MSQKRIIVVATFEADVPNDMDENRILEEVEKELKQSVDCFRIHVKEFSDDENAEPLFDLNRVRLVN